MTTPPSPALTIDKSAMADADAALRDANAAFAARYPGESDARHPIHVVYGGAQLFAAETAAKVGAVALRAFGEFVPTPALLGDALGIPGHPSLATIHERVWGKLRREPVEDYRIDFEDGYGIRSDLEEDRAAVRIAIELARGIRSKSLPPFIGIRVKALTEETRERSIRTLDLVHTGLVKEGSLPHGWTITLPKVTVPQQVEYFSSTLKALECGLGLPDGILRFEVMVEAPQLIIDQHGVSRLPALIDAASGRLKGVHFGTYDYTSACNITGAYQRMRHPSCEFAKAAMQAAYAGTGIHLSDGATSILPVPVHRATPAGPPLTKQQRADNTAAMRSAWKMHFDDVHHSLSGGFYQGWDLHPAQLVSRYAAVFRFFLEGIRAAGTRLGNFVAKDAQATLVGNSFDDAATAGGLLNFFLRGINAGAITEAEALAMTGLNVAQLRARSFAASDATSAATLRSEAPP
jgi:citrate lyase beta subunit